MPPDLQLVTHAVAPTADFVEAMSTLASSVALVTTRVGERPWGVTVTSFASVAADPPTVLVSLRSDTTAARAIAATGSFGVSILAEEQLAVARRGSMPGATKFLETLGAVRDGALAQLDCELVEAVEVADHTVFFGRVVAARARSAGRPLVYHRRAYGTVVGDTDHQPTERNVRCLSS